MVSLRAIIDAFNVFNANTVLVRNDHVLSTGATGFNSIAQESQPAHLPGRIGRGFLKQEPRRTRRALGG